MSVEISTNPSWLPYYEGLQAATRHITNTLRTLPFIKPFFKPYKKHRTWKKWFTKNKGMIVVPILVSGVVSFMWYKIKVKLSEEDIQHFIMEQYPVDIYDVLQLRRNNYLSTRDVHAFKLVMDAELNEPSSPSLFPSPSSPIPSTSPPSSSTSPSSSSSSSSSIVPGSLSIFPSSPSSSSISSSPMTSSLDPYGLGRQPRLSFELFEHLFSRFFLRPIHDADLLHRLFHSLFKDEYNNLGLREWTILLAMISTGTQSDRLSLCFDVLDADQDQRISYNEFCGFLLLITTMGWSYAKQTYVRDTFFPPSFRRTTPQEMANLLLLHVGVVPVRRWTGLWDGSEEDEGDPYLDRETFISLPLSLV